MCDAQLGGPLAAAADESLTSVAGLSCPVLCAVVRLTLLRVLVLLPFTGDAGLRFDFDLVIGDSFGCAATIAATTEAPPQRRSRRGRIPKRSQRPEPDKVPLW